MSSPPAFSLPGATRSDDPTIIGAPHAAGPAAELKLYDKVALLGVQEEDPDDPDHKDTTGRIQGRGTGAGEWEVLLDSGRSVLVDAANLQLIAPFVPPQEPRATRETALRREWDSFWCLLTLFYCLGATFRLFTSFIVFLLTAAAGSCGDWIGASLAVVSALFAVSAADICTTMCSRACRCCALEKRIPAYVAIAVVQIVCGGVLAAQENPEFQGLAKDTSPCSVAFAACSLFGVFAIIDGVLELIVWAVACIAWACYGDRERPPWGDVLELMVG